MKLKSDLYTANGTRELIVTDQIYNSIQFDEEKTTLPEPPPPHRRRRKSSKQRESRDLKAPKKEGNTRGKVGKRTASEGKVVKGRAIGHKGQERRKGRKRTVGKSDSSVLTEMTSVKSSRTSSR